jgi:hypothetical protein
MERLADRRQQLGEPREVFLVVCLLVPIGLAETQVFVSF